MKSLQSRVTDMFFFNDTATTEIYTLSLHDALPICFAARVHATNPARPRHVELDRSVPRSRSGEAGGCRRARAPEDRKSTRLNSSHANISDAVFCLKKKNSYYSL